MTEQMKNLRIDEDPTFEFKDAEYLDPEKVDTMEDCNIEPDQLLIMDCKEQQKTWVIKNPYFPVEMKCENCYQYKFLQFPCECKKVSYCSEQCKTRDEYYHLPKCEKEDSDEEKILKYNFKENSKRGLCGLRNLGNTCYMNSAIQCISNTWEISRYFLDNSYKMEINAENPLGSKGQLVNKFSYLLKKIWFETKDSLAAFSFKKLVGELQPQYQGYSQHDAQEFAQFLLDGINEDLNRIPKKPYIEIPDSEGRDDYEVAKEQWEIFKKRNDSIIIENMYGQYKSMIQCPNCAKISITFDPYLMASITIPQDNRKELKLEIVSSEYIWKNTQQFYFYDRMKELTFREILLEKAEEWLNADENQIILTCSSNYMYEDVFIDEYVHVLKKKLKTKKLYLRKMSQYELSIPLEKRIFVTVHNCSQQNSWKKDICHQLNFVLPTDINFKDIHLQLYKAHQSIIKDIPGFEDIWLEKENQEEIYKNEILNKFWKLEFKSNSTYQIDCSFCGKSGCNDYCEVGFDEEKNLKVCLEKSQQLLQIEIYIIWLKGFGNMTENLYDDWQRYHINKDYRVEDNKKGDVIALGYKEQKQKKSSHEYTLQFCLNFSQQPEQLGEDNTWYCSSCQDHVQAFKTMQLYKTPKILIFHLKRFKDSYKQFKSKLQSMVEFPIENLNMKEFVLNHKLPQDYGKYNKDEINNENDLLYDLYGVINHFGGLGGGHYTAFCKNPEEQQWYNYDDTHVTKIIDLDSIVSSNAYVLFYKKKGLEDNYEFQSQFDKNLEQLLKASE